MTALVTLADRGQDYIRFEIVENHIMSVQPSGKAGWYMTRVLFPDFRVGERLYIELHKGYRFFLEPRIIEISSLVQKKEVFK